MSGWVYIMASKPRGTPYIGVTNNLIRRVQEHREGQVEGFTRKYGCKSLVYYEEYNTVPLAIQREKT